MLPYFVDTIGTRFGDCIDGDFEMLMPEFSKKCLEIVVGRMG